MIENPIIRNYIKQLILEFYFSLKLISKVGIDKEAEFYLLVVCYE